MVKSYPKSEIRLLIVAFAFIFISGCDEEICADFPVKISKLQPFDSSINLTNFDVDIINAAKSEISRCHSRSSYYYSDFEPTFQKLILTRDNKVALIYEFFAVTDVRLAFVIDKKGKIVEIFEYSAL